MLLILHASEHAFGHSDYSRTNYVLYKLINVYIDMDRFLLSSLDCDMLLNIADWPPKMDNKY